MAAANEGGPPAAVPLSPAGSGESGGGLTEGERAQVRSWVQEQSCGEWDDFTVTSDANSLCGLFERFLRDRAALSQVPS